MKCSDSISNRLKYAMEISGIKQYELVEKTKIPKGSISQYVTGYVEPKSDRIYLLAKALNVNPVWLMGMDVPMEPPTVDYTVTNGPLSGTAIEVASVVNQVSSDARLLHYMQALLSLPEDKRKLIEDITYSYLPNSEKD